MKKNKHRKGLTLVELIIAVTVLGIGIAGIITAFTAGFSMSARANYTTIASIEAQLQMESLVGLTEAQLMTAGFTWNNPFQSNYMWVMLDLSSYGATTPMLRQATVYIFRSEAEATANDWFFRHSNILNVTGNIS
jgi:prepilin-type N-terminal cleavage/methylation domain-containing protein